MKRSDSLELHGSESRAKLMMCAEALEVGSAVSFKQLGLADTVHKVIIDERNMQVSLVYAASDSPYRESSVVQHSGRGVEKIKLLELLQQSNSDFVGEGIEIIADVTSIETLPLSA